MKTVLWAIARMIKKAFFFAEDILFPKACCLCGETVSEFFSKEGFLLSADGRKIQTPFCGICTCQLEKAFGSWKRNEFPPDAEAEFIFDYSYETVRLLLFHIKKRKCTCCNAFISELTAPYFEKYVSEGCSVTYIPRNRINFRKYGQDQSKMIVEKQLKNGIVSEYPELFVRRKSIFYGKPQKTLDPAKRTENAAKTLLLSSSFKIPQKLLVFDDMITTGATAQTAKDLVVSKYPECDVKFLFLAGMP